LSFSASSGFFSSAACLLAYLSSASLGLASPTDRCLRKRRRRRSEVCVQIQIYIFFNVRHTTPPYVGRLFVGYKSGWPTGKSLSLFFPPFFTFRPYSINIQKIPS
jgi:hypothetical protein